MNTKPIILAIDDETYILKTLKEVLEDEGYQIETLLDGNKAIDLIDEASSRVRLQASSLPPEGKEIEKELKQVIRDKEQAIRNQEFEKASQLRDTEAELKDKIREVGNY